MALTREQHDEILKRIVDRSNLEDDLMNDVEVLRENYIEVDTAGGGEGEDWKSRYDDVVEKYKARFFSPPDEKSAKRKGDDAKEENKKDVKRDGEEQTYDDLFMKREG